jgi:hypothetical protein
MLAEELKEYLRTPPVVKKVATELSYHEGLKAQLYIFGFKHGYYPVLEASPTEIGTKKISCAFCTKEGQVVIAIELNKYPRKESVIKLRMLPGATERIVVAYGGRKNSYVKAMLRREGELTEEEMKGVTVIRLKLFRPELYGGWKNYR